MFDRVLNKHLYKPYNNVATGGVLQESFFKNLAKFTGKNLCQGRFFNKVSDLTWNVIKKETLAQVFSSEFCEFFNIFFTEHLWATAFVCTKITLQRFFL